MFSARSQLTIGELHVRAITNAGVGMNASMRSHDRQRLRQMGIGFRPCVIRGDVIEVAGNQMSGNRPQNDGQSLHIRLREPATNQHLIRRSRLKGFPTP